MTDLPRTQVPIAAFTAPGASSITECPTLASARSDILGMSEADGFRLR